MNSLVLYRSPTSSTGMENPPYPVTTAAGGCVACHLPTTMGPCGGGGGGNGTSAELAWELIDIFESGMFAFPIYDHDSARDIVRYLLEREILEEEIADAIKDSTVDMNIWLEKGDKYMVGEWVIAWINACREDYVKQRHSHGGGAPTVGYRKRPGGTLDGSMDSLGGHHMDDDDDHDAWGGRLCGMNDKDEEDGHPYRGAEMHNSPGFGGVPIYSSGLSFGQCDPMSDEANAAKWSVSSPSSPPTPFHRLAPYLRRTDQPGGASAGARRKNVIGAVCWRSVTSPSLHHLLQTVVTDEKSDSGIVSDLFDRASHDYDYVDDEEEEEAEVEEMEEEDRNDVQQSDRFIVALQKSVPCNVVDASFGSRCTCKLPHYASYPSSPTWAAQPCPGCGTDEQNTECHASVTAGAAAGARGNQGQYYKDFIIRALEYTLETLDRDGPGYLFILTDPEDRPMTWSSEQRFRVASSNRPELCLAAYRSRNIDVDLLWQVKVNHHNKMSVDVQTVLEKYRLHSNWFKCSLSTVMETVHAVMSCHRHRAFSTSCHQMNES